MGKKEWKAMKKKRTFSNMITGFFNDDSKFMTFIGRVALLASANVCWLVCSLPAVTGGAALIALYTVLLERKEQTYDTAFKRFFQVFAKTLLPSLPLWLLTLGVGTALATAWRIVLRENLTDHFFLLAPLLLASAVMAIALLWLFPLLASGETAWREALPAAFHLGLRELGRALQRRYTPELQFIADDSIQYGAHILEVLRDPDKVKPVNPDNDAVLPDEEA